MTVIQQTTPVTRFCLIRHGETDWNRARRIQGQIDIDLNATGEAQAQALVHGLREHHFAAAYSSDLLRAWRTAQIASRRLGVAVLPAPTLRERHFGVLQGCTHDEAQERWPEAYRHHQSRTPDYDYQDGESLNVFAARVHGGAGNVCAQASGRASIVIHPRRCARRGVSPCDGEVCGASPRFPVGETRRSTGWSTILVPGASFPG
jgi:probable phosphoglycerate mutase